MIDTAQAVLRFINNEGRQHVTQVLGQEAGAKAVRGLRDSVTHCTQSDPAGLCILAHRTVPYVETTRSCRLARVLGEYGRISRILHLLAFVDEGTYRRCIHVQLNRHEGRDALMRSVFQGRPNKLRQSYREAQEDLDALNFVVNAIALWSARGSVCLFDYLRDNGIEVRHVARRSLLGQEQINLLGGRHFGLPEEALGGGPRAL